MSLRKSGMASDARRVGEEGSSDMGFSPGCEGEGVEVCVRVGEGKLSSASDSPWRTASLEGESDTRLLSLGVTGHRSDSIIVTGVDALVKFRYGSMMVMKVKEPERMVDTEHVALIRWT